MKNIIFINKYKYIKDEISHCIPEGSKFKDLDGKGVLIGIATSAQKIEVLKCCRKSIGRKKEVLIQSVIHYADTNQGFEITVPKMKLFL